MATPHSAFSRKWRNATYLYNFYFFIRNDWLGAQMITSNPENEKKARKIYGDAPYAIYLYNFWLFFSEMID